MAYRYRKRALIRPKVVRPTGVVAAAPDGEIFVAGTYRLLGDFDERSLVLRGGGATADVAEGGAPPGGSLPGLSVPALTVRGPNPTAGTTVLEGGGTRGRIDLRALPLVVRRLRRQLLRRARHHRQPGALGVHTFAWDGRATGGDAVAAGVYFAKLHAMGQERTVKLIRRR
jgi:hypothetical protein